MFSEVEVLVPLVEHVHPLGVVHPFPHQQLLPLQAAVNPVKHRAEYYQHAQQSKLRDGVIVDQAGHENAQGYPRLGGYNRSGGGRGGGGKRTIARYRKMNDGGKIASGDTEFL